MDASQASYSSDSCLRHVLSKFLLYHFCASSECLLCCPTLFFPRTSIFVLLVLLVAAAAAASPGATSSVTSGLALGVARPACVVVASPRLVAQSSSCRAIFWGVIRRAYAGGTSSTTCASAMVFILTGSGYVVATGVCTAAASTRAVAIAGVSMFVAAVSRSSAMSTGAAAAAFVVT